METLIKIALEQGYTVSQAASMVRELIKQLDIPSKKFEEAALNPPSAEKQKEVAQNLSLTLNEINQKSQAEGKIKSVEIEQITFINQQLFSLIENNKIVEETAESEFKSNSTSKNDDNSGNPTEDSQEDKRQPIATESQIQQFVIPMIIKRLNTYGKLDNETQSIVYKGEEYTASLRLEKGLQTLSLDRTYPELEENQESLLLASRNNNSEEYSIIINNLTKDELERLKALFEQQARREENQQLTQTKQSDKELG